MVGGGTAEVGGQVRDFVDFAVVGGEGDGGRAEQATLGPFAEGQARLSRFPLRLRLFFSGDFDF